MVDSTDSLSVFTSACGAWGFAGTSSGLQVIRWHACCCSNRNTDIDTWNRHLLRRSAVELSSVTGIETWERHRTRRNVVEQKHGDLGTPPNTAQNRRTELCNRHRGPGTLLSTRRNIVEPVLRVSGTET